MTAPSGTQDVWILAFDVSAGEAAEGLSELFGLDEMRAAALVASVPRAVRRGLSRTEAGQTRAALESIGARVAVPTSGESPTAEELGEAASPDHSDNATLGVTGPSPSPSPSPSPGGYAVRPPDKQDYVVRAPSAPRGPAVRLKKVRPAPLLADEPAYDAGTVAFVPAEASDHRALDGLEASELAAVAEIELDYSNAPIVASEAPAPNEMEVEPPPLLLATDAPPPFAGLDDAELELGSLIPAPGRLSTGDPLTLDEVAAAALSTPEQPRAEAPETAGPDLDLIPLPRGLDRSEALAPLPFSPATERVRTEPHAPVSPRPRTGPNAPGSAHESAQPRKDSRPEQGDPDLPPWMRFLPELGAAAAGALVLTFGLLLGSSIFYGNRGLFGVLIDAQGVFLGLAALVSAVQKLRGAE